MNVFKLITPATYWLLIILWSFILLFYIKRLRLKQFKGRLIITLVIILTIDALRTLFESVFFGAWYTSQEGLIAENVKEFLVRPEIVFVPKILNVIAAVIIIAVLLYRWLPNEGREIEELEIKVNERTAELKKHQYHLEEMVTERIAELKKMVNLMAGREIRMTELKKAIEKLRAQLESAGLTPVVDDPLREGGKSSEK